MLTALAKAAVRIRGMQELSRLKAAAADVRAAQTAVLRSILERSSKTVFGSQFGVSPAWTVEQFRKAVPMCTYEDIRPWVEAEMCGFGVRPLCPDEPALFYETSGTTGHPKWIPISQSTLVWSRAMQMLAGYGVLRARPRILDGRILAIAGSPQRRSAPCGAAISSKSGSVYTNLHPLIRRKFIVPPLVFSMEDYILKYLVVLRLALASGPVTYLQTANTSTVLLLADLLNEHWGGLVDGITSGGFHLDTALAPDLRRQLSPLFAADSARGAELRRIRRQAGSEAGSFGRVRLRDVFPDLQALSCWLSGSNRLFVSRLKDEIPAAALLRDIGYISSEFNGTVPIDGDGTAAVPVFTRIYFEFVPRAAWEAGDRQACGLDQLEEGVQYYLLATTPDGLLRYQMNDIVEVCGRFGTVPRLSFVRKGMGMTNITGEKLSEDQLICAVKGAESELRFRVHFAFGLADERTCRYRVYCEPETPLPIGAAQADQLAAALDRLLTAQNLEYADKRQSGRLRPLVVSLLVPGTLEAFRRSWSEKGRYEAQFKFAALALKGEEEFDFAPYVSFESVEEGQKRFPEAANR